MELLDECRNMTGGCFAEFDFGLGSVIVDVGVFVTFFNVVVTCFDKLLVSFGIFVICLDLGIIFFNDDVVVVGFGVFTIWLDLDIISFSKVVVVGFCKATRCFGKGAIVFVAAKVGCLVIELLVEVLGNRFSVSGFKPSVNLHKEIRF